MLFPCLAGLALLLAGGCTCARQADNSETKAPVVQQGAQSARSGAQLVDDQDLPGDQEANQAGADQGDDSGEEEEASDDGGNDGSTEGEDQQNGDDEDGAVDENGDGGGNQNGEEETDPGEEAEPPETGDGAGGDEGNGEESEPPAPNPDIDAAAIYQAAMCGNCHGEELDGTQRGPSLKNLDEYWDAVNLAQFLKSPAYYSEGNRRLIEMAHQYNIAMPPLHRNDEEIYALAYWLINH